MPLIRKAWQLTTPEWMAYEDLTVEITHWKLAKFEWELDRSEAGKPGFIRVYLSPTTMPAADIREEPDVLGLVILLTGAEYDAALNAMAAITFADVEGALYPYLVATNRLAPGTLVDY